MKMNGVGILEVSGESIVCKSFVVVGTCGSSISIFLSESDFAFSLNACNRKSSSYRVPRFRPVIYFFLSGCR